MTLGVGFGRCVDTAMVPLDHTLVAATWSGDLVEGSSGRWELFLLALELNVGSYLCRLLAAAAHGGQRVTRLSVAGEG